MNADRKLSVKQRIYWIFLALSSYFKSLFINHDIKIIENIPLAHKVTTSLSSPTRVYTDNLIYNYIPWNDLKNELKEIYICEFGCGNLRYLKAFNNLLGEGNFKYIGIEAPGFELNKEAKNLLNDKIEFVNQDLNKGVPDNIKNCNIFLSFSVLEHIDEIKSFTEKYSAKASAGSYHYHSVPTFLSIFNYLWHGCRHFNSIEIKALLQNFSNKSVGIIFYGGIMTLIFHSLLITLTSLFFKVLKHNYKIEYFSHKLATSIVKFSQQFDNLTTKIGIHTFCLLFWKKEK